jgi:glycolate oxidase
MNTVLQGLRDSVWAAEFVDSNGMRFVPPELQLEPDFDILFLEARESSWETVIETLLQTGISDENIFELTETKYHAVRKAVPRGIFEANSRAGVSKQGTDVQVHTKDFQKILEKYQEAAQIGIPYTLFGHFGDSHLHFNFNLNPGQETLCHSFFESLYTCAREWGASPFAEHGIGYLKKPFILPFYHSSQKKLFQILKNEFDPHRILFPQGFMS